MKLAKLIYETLEKNNKQWTPRNHYPSSASFKYADGTTIGPDILSQYLKWSGVVPSNPPNGKALLKMGLGNSAHNVIADILAKAGIKAKSEVKGESIIPGLKNKISYRVDGLQEFNEKLEVLEVKSSTDQMMFGAGWGIEDKGPKREHLLQVICYLNTEPGVKVARLLYVSRDSGELIEYEVERLGDSYTLDGNPIPELSFAGIVARWALLETHLENKQLPLPDYKVWLNDSGRVMPVKTINKKQYKSDWQAMYDPYRDLIWTDPKNFQHTYNAKFGLVKA